MKKLLLLMMALCLVLTAVPGSAAIYYELWGFLPPVGSGDTYVDANADGNGDYALLAADLLTLTAPTGKDGRAATGTDTNFRVGPSNDWAEVYMFRQIGLVNIATAGGYSFWCDSDDGSIIYVDGVLVANFDGLHGGEGAAAPDPGYGKTLAPINLGAGYHLIEVWMYENGGGDMLEVRYAMSTDENQAVFIPDADLSLPVLPINPAGWAEGVRLTGTTLEWTNPLAGSGFEVHMNIAGDPNEKTATVAGAAIDLDTLWGALDPETRYQIRIDTVVDANTVPGAIFMFDTETDVPVITGQPQGVVVGPGGCTGAFTIVATSGTYDNYGDLSYQWYQVATPDDILLSGETAATLNTDVSGAYYVVVSNDKGETVSASARLTSVGGESVLYDFEGGGPGFTVNGNATVDSGSMRLTEDAGSLNGSVIFDPISTDPVDYFKVSFDFQARDPGGADGMSFALMDAGVFGSTAIFGESGPGVGSLSIGIDLYDNGGEAEVGGNYFDIRLDNVVIASAVPSFTMEGTGWHHVDMSFNSGLLTLAVTPQGGVPETLFDAVPVTGYAPFAGRFGFGARTGGVSNEHRVDNVLFGGPDWAAQNIEVSPVDGNGWLDYNTENVTVTWDKAQLTPCDAVYTLYLRMESLAGNMDEFVAYQGQDLQAVVPNGGNLAHDQMWYGHIDVSSQAGAGTQAGETFSISTIKWVPAIATQPQDVVVVNAGADATLQCTASSLDDDAAVLTEFEWYHVGDANPVYTGIPSEISRDGSKRLYDCSVILTIQDVSHEGLYYCIARNDNGEAQSANVTVVTRRLMVHFTFDELNGNTVTDSSPAGGFDGTLTSPQEGGVPAGVSIVPGVIGNAIDLTGGQDPNSGYVATSASALDLGIRGANPRSVSVWAKTRDMARSGIYSIGMYSSSMQTFGVHNQNDPGTSFIYQFDHWGSNYDYTDISAFGRWVHFVHIYDGQNIRIYADGIEIANYAAALNTGTGDGTQDLAVGLWGAYDASYQHGVFNGSIDDFRLYNYALSPQEVGQLWILGGGTSGCTRALSQDFNGDCRVDLKDFATLATSWMDSSLITP
jgi:hypothetical protein